MKLSCVKICAQKNHRLIKLTRMTSNVGKGTLAKGPICFGWPAGVTSKRKLQDAEGEQAMWSMIWRLWDSCGCVSFEEILLTSSASL